MEAFSIHLDMMALWLATVIIFAIAFIWLNAKVLRIAGKVLKSNTEISSLKTTVEELVKSIDRTLYSILDEMGQSSTPSLAARWSLNPPVNSYVINMVDDWMDKAGTNGSVKTDNKKDKPDKYGIKWEVYGNYEQYPVKTFQFKCLEGKDPKTWPLTNIDEGSTVSPESGSVFNV